MKRCVNPKKQAPAAEAAPTADTHRFDLAFEEVGKLVRAFAENESHYRSGKYSEAEARKDFIDKFWIALGWDVNHDTQTNPYEQEVKVERNVHTSGSQRRADYAFYLAPNFHDVRFFVEAKKPSADIETAQNYFQVIRYGWNSQTPLAVLTDFEQFHVLDCRYRPDNDTALLSSVWKFHYTEYADHEKFRRIYWLFSREAVADASIEKRAAELPRPPGRAARRGLARGGYQSIDESFLAQLDEFREALARSLKLRNPDLSGDALTEISQRTLDRLVFLRFLEDKGIEPERLVEHFGKRRSAWEDFTAAGRRLDSIYNGIVYKRHDIIDGGGLAVDDEVFARICRDLAHANSPYDFNAIPIHILGSIYERFLGKVITATPRRAKVEEKPEVRKAGGVYYTPEYIVRYIVDNTVGKLIEGKTPEQIAKMRFADISCGSGSFLLGVFDCLLNYHGQYYNQNPDKARKGDCAPINGRLHLTLKKKREILLNNIYGVDIDAQAVEVCQLSLYLKLLQEETEASTRQYALDFLHQSKMKKLLPDLSKNIVCGNSLIGRDINGDLFEEVEKKLNPMDFEDAFPHVMKAGGFDAVVGNPPYVRIQTIRESVPVVLEYLPHHYRAATRGNYDIYVVFVEKGLRILNTSGQLGFILPHKFFNAKYGQPLRAMLADGRHLTQVVHFGDTQVFAGATTYTSLLFLSKSASESFIFTSVEDLGVWLRSESHEPLQMNANQVTAAPWSFVADQAATLLNRISEVSPKLGEISHTFVGTQTSCDSVFVLENCSRAGGFIEGDSRALSRRVRVERQCVVPFLHGKDIRRFMPLASDSYLICPYEIAEDSSALFTEKTFRNRFPLAYEYLLANKSTLAAREKGRIHVDKWFAFGYPKSMSLFQNTKIVVPDYNDQASFTIDSEGHFFKTGYGVILRDQRTSLYFVLGLLNSKLLFWFLKSTGTALRGGYVRFWSQYIERLPIYVPESSQHVERKLHDSVVAKVQTILEAKKLLARAKTEKDKTYYEKKCASLDRQIDKLVYELYGLTDEEIAIVECATTAE
ncbi:MAG: TaqI-like C-terminal specificity domain-containing protein [Candidatus Zixiibacteriota bacterium]